MFAMKGSQLWVRSRSPDCEAEGAQAFRLD